MNARLPHMLLTLAAVILLAATSVFSAARMVPQSAPSAELVAYLSVAGDLAEFCGSTSDDHHDCPFCRLLSDPPAATAACPQTLARSFGMVRPDDLTLGPQGGNPRSRARAPPRIA